MKQFIEEIFGLQLEFDLSRCGAEIEIVGCGLEVLQVLRSTTNVSFKVDTFYFIRTLTGDKSIYR